MTSSMTSGLERRQGAGSGYLHDFVGHRCREEADGRPHAGSRGHQYGIEFELVARCSRRESGPHHRRRSGSANGDFLAPFRRRGRARQRPCSHRRPRRWHRRTSLNAIRDPSSCHPGFGHLATRSTARAASTSRMQASHRRTASGSSLIQYHVGIGHRGVRATPTVAGGSRFRSGALRADLDAAQSVDRGQANHRPPRSRPSRRPGCVSAIRCLS